MPDDGRETAKTGLAPVTQTSERSVDYWRTVIRHALMDCSTVDYHDLSEAAVDNMALVAAQTVAADLAAYD